MFTLASLSDPDPRAAPIYDLESRLAEVQWSDVVLVLKATVLAAQNRRRPFDRAAPACE
jgi:hypothetical protein